MRALLLPISFLYGVIIAFRNWFYDLGIFPSTEFNTNIIAIGNLSVGGTGKSPMTEYLITLLKEKYLIATLSRGYKRHTKGFIIADGNSTSSHIGDEPLQFKKKFPDLIVAVDENRKHGIQKLLEQFSALKIIVLDDAFQHRRVKPGLNILLSNYNNMFYEDRLLPSGNLREWKDGKKRADLIVVTKCPTNITPVEKRVILKKISPYSHQQVLFAHIKYGEPVPMFTSPLFLLDNSSYDATAILFTGIADPKPLEDFLVKKNFHIHAIAFPDHHEYTMVDVTALATQFHTIRSTPKMIITTEKDAMRLDKLGLVEVLRELPIYFIPIETVFDANEKKEFDQLITNYVFRTNQKNSHLH